MNRSKVPTNRGEAAILAMTGPWIVRTEAVTGITRGPYESHGDAVLAAQKLAVSYPGRKVYLFQAYSAFEAPLPKAAETVVKRE